MLHNILRSTPVEFRSSFDLSESVARLQAATQRSSFRIYARQVAVGPVTATRVRLQRLIPMVGNAFKPFFFGRFETRVDAVYLTGRFAMLGFVKAFLTLWFGAMVAMMAMVVVCDISRHRLDWEMLAACIGMIAAGCAILLVGRWFAGNDVTWISNVIRSALSPPASKAACSPSMQSSLEPDASSSAPIALKITALMLVVTGVMDVLSAVFDIASHRSGNGHNVGMGFQSEPMRLAFGAWGVWSLILSVGVYRRRMWAWRMGLLFLGTCGAFGVFSSWQEQHQLRNSPTWFAMIFGCGMALVTLVWMRWWYVQRSHFRSDGDYLA